MTPIAVLSLPALAPSGTRSAPALKHSCWPVSAMTQNASRASAIFSPLRQPLIWAGIALWAGEVIAWILVLQRTPLSIAYPVMTLVYVGVPFGGVLLLGERISQRQVLGAGFVALGVLCVALSGGS